MLGVTLVIIVGPSCEGRGVLVGVFRNVLGVSRKAYPVTVGIFFWLVTSSV